MLGTFIRDCGYSRAKAVHDAFSNIDGKSWRRMCSLSKSSGCKQRFCRDRIFLLFKRKQVLNNDIRFAHSCGKQEWFSPMSVVPRMLQKCSDCVIIPSSYMSPRGIFTQGRMNKGIRILMAHLEKFQNTPLLPKCETMLYFLFGSQEVLALFAQLRS